MLTTLPRELVELILCDLDLQSLNACCLVSKSFNHLINNDVVSKKFKQLCKRSYLNEDEEWNRMTRLMPDCHWSNIRILSMIDQNHSERPNAMPADQWQCYFLVKNASHYQIRYTVDHSDYGDYTRVNADYPFTQPVTKYLSYANYPSLSAATKALAKISADRDHRANDYYYPRVYKISTSFDLVEYIADEIDNCRVFVCHWSIVLIE